MFVNSFVRAIDLNPSLDRIATVLTASVRPLKIYDMMLGIEVYALLDITRRWFDEDESSCFFMKIY